MSFSMPPFRLLAYLRVYFYKSTLRSNFDSVLTTVGDRLFISLVQPHSPINSATFACRFKLLFASAGVSTSIYTAGSVSLRQFPGLKLWLCLLLAFWQLLLGLGRPLFHNFIKPGELLATQVPFQKTVSGTTH